MEKLKCLICKKSFYHLGSHLWHGHKILAKEYKEDYGLPYNLALISDEIKKKKSIHFWENKDRYLPALLKTSKYRFKKGHSGVRRISEKERETIIKRINDVNKRKKSFLPCIVCKMKFYHVESHLYNAHKLIKIK